MPPLSSDDVRRDFIRFWQEHGCQPQPSSSLIPYNDPTVLFTIAGMQQFVRYFLGLEASPHTRYVTVQKCFRTNDIDEVGDPRHLTFFEMMGNFSIGDYFKADVIPWAYELVTQRLGLEQERLWITVHDSDDEAERIWRSVGIPAERIERRGDADNWWGPPGKSGPCGPDSEIYYQQDPGHGCGYPDDPPDCDCGRLEFWNLVFMQFFQAEDGSRTEMEKKNIDTGIGLERTAALVQKAASVYETDLFTPIIQAAAGLAGKRYGENERTDYALRVLADHGRGMTFLVADGVIPGTGGREYVLRRIIRRASRFARKELGVEGAFLGHIVRATIDRMSSFYPELERDSARILQVVENEEELFGRTLAEGSAQLDRLIAESRARGETQVSGARVFDLWQTKGFPMELTEEALRAEGLVFSRSEYETALAAEQERGRRAAGFKHAQHGGESEFGELPETTFLAWSETQSDARVQGVRGAAGRQKALQAGEPGRVVLEATAFYPEGGGQVGDRGQLVLPTGIFEVEDTRVDGAGHVVHVGRVAAGSVEVGAFGRGEVDLVRRRGTTRHHTLTHLLHRALKDVLGEATSQQGSLVSPEMARFDFNYPRAMSSEQVEEVTARINEHSMEDLPVNWEIMDMARAQKSGAIMMFGEKYGEHVRVVSIGAYSKELCGGTHAHHSGELGLGVVASESGIGSGKRRIVAYAGDAALAYYRGRLRLLDELAGRLGATGADDVGQRLDSLLGELEGTRRTLESLQQQRAQGDAAQMAASAHDVSGVRVVARQAEGATDEDLKRLADTVREHMPSGVVVLAAVSDGKPRFVVGLTQDLAAGRLHAGKLVGAVARAAGGGGNGRPDFATGGGGKVDRLPHALQQVDRIVEEMMRTGAGA